MVQSGSVQEATAAAANTSKAAVHVYHGFNVGAAHHNKNDPVCLEAWMSHNTPKTNDSIYACLII